MGHVCVCDNGERESLPTRMFRLDFFCLDFDDDDDDLKTYSDSGKF